MLILIIAIVIAWFVYKQYRSLPNSRGLVYAGLAFVGAMIFTPMVLDQTKLSFQKEATASAQLTSPVKY
jgi:hypothetical protein